MRLSLVMLASIILSFGTAAQDDRPQAVVSKDPLTVEEIAVYRAILKDYSKGSVGPVNLANKTGPLARSGLFFDSACVKGIELESASDSVPVLHLLTLAVAPNSRIVLVDPEEQERKIEENDPDRLLRRDVDGHEQAPARAIDHPVRRAFETGLFALSEIAFDNEHRHAMVAYSFRCGMLCGHGKTVILTKAGEHWKVSKTCRSWVS